MSHVRFARQLPLAAGLLATLVACSDSPLPGGHHLTEVEFPLIENFSANCNQLLAEREAAGMPESTLTNAVEFAASLDEAFERATREDKPVMIATFVRENGDPHCDV